MDYLIAVLCLAGACVGWYGVQLWAGKPDAPFWVNSQRDCDSCVSDGEAVCADPPPPSGASNSTGLGTRRSDCPLVPGTRAH